MEKENSVELLPSTLVFRHVPNLFLPKLLYAKVFISAIESKLEHLPWHSGGNLVSEKGWVEVGGKMTWPAGISISKCFWAVGFITAH